LLEAFKPGRREEWFKFMSSFCYFKADIFVIGGLTQIIKAILDMKKIIAKRSNLFWSTTESRRGFPGLVETDLKSFLKWLFSQFESDKREYRRQCMKLFQALSQCDPGTLTIH
jgi:hypothetical protein